MHSDLAKAHQAVLQISFNDIIVIPQHTSDIAVSLTLYKIAHSKCFGNIE